MKTILSWDVGIINLAYCLICKTSDTEFEIKKWGVINLLVDDQIKCQYPLRTGNTCQSIAKFHIYHKDKIHLTNIENVCTKHKNKAIPIVLNIEEECKLKKNKKDFSNFKCCIDSCDNNIKYALYNTQEYTHCWCNTHYEKKGLLFIKKIATKKLVNTSCKKEPKQSLAEKLFTALDEKFDDFINADEVLIENQPSMINPTMKAMSSNLYSYFIIRGIIDKNKTNSTIELIKFVSPSNKLKVNSEKTNKLLNDEKNKDKNIDNAKNVYKLTKSLGIKYCKALITEKDNKLLDEYKKKDDICDAFLQAFQYLFSPMPDIHFKKIAKIGFDTKAKAKAKPKIKKNILN
jgi:hypothetical protein